MSMDKMRFQQFVKQAKGNKIFEIQVSREDKASAVVLSYKGKAHRQRNVLNGRWTIKKGEQDDAALTQAVQDFLAMARKHFIVQRGPGLEDEAYADAAQEQKVEQIKKAE